MKVLKFGGTSLATAEKIRFVTGIVAEAGAIAPVVVVVSAHAGVTDALLATASNFENYKEGFDGIAKLHRDIISNLGLDEKLVDAELSELDELLRGIALVRELTPRARDYAASFGERMSAQIVAAAFRKAGIKAKAFAAYDVGFTTDDNFGYAAPLEEAKEAVREKLPINDVVPVVTGFIGKTAEGDVTTIGRSGSDYTASFFGAALGADEIQIWTDVDGVMTADPRVVDNPRPLSELSFDEASELARYGAEVLHPATILPAVEAKIPVRVKNTEKPDSPGTLILHEIQPTKAPLKSIVYKRDLTLINVVPLSISMGKHYGFMAELFAALENHRISVDMISTSEVSVSLVVESTDRVARLLKDLAQFANATAEEAKSIVCVIGENLRDSIGVSGTVFQTLRRERIAVDMVSLGATKINLSFVVDDTEVEKTVRVLHKTFFEQIW